VTPFGYPCAWTVRGSENAGPAREAVNGSGGVGSLVDGDETPVPDLADLHYSTVMAIS
jgi:hypothetical protein